MKQLFKIIIFCFLLGIVSVNISAQKYDCINLDSSRNQLYLTDDDFALIGIDDALHFFKLSSIAGKGDSLVRIWLLESSFPDTPYTTRLKMFEFGKNGKKYTATLHLLDRGSIDDSFSVKCIQKVKLIPIDGWNDFRRDIKGLNLPALYKRPPTEDYVHVSFGMFVVQFLFGTTTHTVDFTASDLHQPKAAPHLNHTARITYLILYLEKHFLLNFSANSINSNGYDFLDDAKRQLSLKK